MLLLYKKQVYNLNLFNPCLTLGDSVKTHCLSCKYYLIKDPLTGLCRHEVLTSGNRTAQKPQVHADHSCPEWINCGQSYYIRLGWIKKNQADNKS